MFEFQIQSAVKLVIDLWLEEIKRRIPSAREHDDAFLKDHMPLFLDSVFRILNSKKGMHNYLEALKNAQIHGSQRATSPHYRVSEVILEYTYLRETIFSHIRDNSAGFPDAKFLMLTRIFEGAIGSSTEEFVAKGKKPRTNPAFEDLSQVFVGYDEFLESHNEAFGESELIVREGQPSSEARFRSVFSHAAVGFVVSMLDGRILEVNPRFCEMTGYSEAELRKQSLNDLVYEGDRRRETDVLGLLTSGVSRHQVIEKRFIKKNGELVWLRNSVSLDRGLSGETLLIRVVEDVTEARTADQLRRESEARFATLANSMPQIVWTATAEGRLDYFNEVWFEFSGTGFEENVGNGWQRAIHPDDFDRTLENWGRSVAEGRLYENEFRLRSASGDYRWFFARAVPTFDDQGKAVKWYGTNTDIHNAKIVSDKLRMTTGELQSEQLKFLTIIADSPSSMAVLKGPDFVYEIANRSYLELFHNRELIGKSFVEALPEISDQEFPRLAQSVFDTGVPYAAREVLAYLRRTDNGRLEERYFDQSYSRMNDQEGKPYGVFIHALEVTDRVLSRRSLEETMERYRLALEAANMGTWELDTKTFEVNWSKRARELFGARREGVILLDEIVPTIHDEDRERVKAAIAAAIDPAGDGNYNIRYRVVQENGDIRWVSLLGKTFFVETPTGRESTRFAGTVLDVTDTVLAEAMLRDAKDRAEIANDAKSAFLANMSHEIRTPLGAIMGFVSLLRDADLEKADMEDYLGVIERNSTQLLRIIDDILDLSKVEAGKMLIEHVNFSLLEVLADFSSLMGFRARENGIDFRVKAETTIPNPVNSDPTRIRQILNNVVGNAIKFTARGRVDLLVSYEDSFLTFKVKDSGRGISPEQVAGLFQPFAQADVSTTRKFGGTGLGLVLTKKLCEALGGDFWLEESELGKGRSFIARFRVGIPEASNMIGGASFGFSTETIPSSNLNLPALKGMKILVVEDSPDNRLLIRVLLTRNGAEVTLASDGLEGVEVALSRDFDLVLMDVQMPRMDGYEAVRELRRQRYPKPVIALTAHAMKEERDKCLLAGYSEFLSKPINQSELIDTVKRYYI